LITTIYGISGAGKTSLINAGMCPLLEKEGFLPIRIRMEHASSKTYSDQIIKSVSEAIDKVGGEIETIDQLGSDEIVPESEKLWMFFYTSSFWSSTNHLLCPVVFIDQFEEIFTKNDDDEVVKTFFDSISALQYDTPPATIARLLDTEDHHTSLKTKLDFRVVLTMREDFLARLEDYAYDSPALRKNRIGIKRMNGTQALDVITRPQPSLVSRKVALNIIAKVSGREVKDTAVFLDQLSVDTSILSLFCSEVYLKAVEQKQDTISNELIDQFGENILASFYINTMKTVPKPTADYLETHLLTRSGFRNAVAKEDVLADGITQEDLNKLSEKRLIRIETSDGTERVEFTHDVLCAIAKEHRNKAIERNNRKQNSSRATGFVVDLVLPLAFLLPFLFRLYVSKKLFSFEDVSAWDFFIAITILLFNTFVLFPYRHSKERKAAFTTIVTLIGSILAEWSLINAYFPSYYYSYNSIGNTKYLTIVTAATFVYYFIHLIRAFIFARKRSFKGALGYTLRCQIYKDHPEMMTILKIAMLVIVLFVSFMVGLSMNIDVAYVTAPLCALASFWLLSSLLGQTTSFNWKAILSYIAQAALVIVILASQFYQRHQLITLLCLASLLVLTVFYVLSNNAVTAKVKKARNILLIWALAFVIIPIANAGYNVFNHAEYNRVDGGCINNYQLLRFLVIEDANHKQGVRDRWNIVVPTEFAKVGPKVQIEFDEYSSNKLLAIESIGPSDLYDYTNRYSRYNLEHEKLIRRRRGGEDPSTNDIVFFVHRDGGNDPEPWLCSQHLDLSRNICTRIVFDAATSSEESLKSFINRNKELDTISTEKIIGLHLKKKGYYGKETPGYYSWMAHYTLFTGNYELSEKYARKSLETDSIMSRTTKGYYLKKGYSLAYASLFNALFFQNKADEAVEVIKDYERRGIFDYGKDEEMNDYYYSYSSYSLDELIEKYFEELSEDSLLSMSEIHEFDSLMDHLKPYFIDKVLKINYQIDSRMKAYICEYNNLIESDWIDKAISLYSKNRKERIPDINESIDLAYMTLFTGNFAKAEQFARASIKADTSNAIAYTNLFNALYLQGKSDESAKIFEKYKNDTVNEYTFEEGVIEDFEELSYYGVIEQLTKDNFDKFIFKNGNNWVKKSDYLIKYILQYSEIVPVSQIEHLIEQYNEKNKLPGDPINYAYFTMFTGDFAKAERYARESVKADSTKAIAYTNLFDALFIQYGPSEEASRIYRIYKDEDVGDLDTFEEGVIEDFQELAKYGVIGDSKISQLKAFLKRYEDKELDLEEED
jgi:hypothetical protein